MMIQRYIGRTLLTNFLLALLVLSALVVPVQLLRRFEEFEVAATDAGLVTGLLAVCRFLPYAAMFAFLISLCYTYGRMAQDGEVEAFMCSGRGAWVLLAPALWFSLVLVSLNVYLTNVLVPYSRRMMRVLPVEQLREALSAGGVEALPGTKDSEIASLDLGAGRHMALVGAKRKGDGAPRYIYWHQDEADSISQIIVASDVETSLGADLTEPVRVEARRGVIVELGPRVALQENTDVTLAGFESLVFYLPPLEAVERAVLRPNPSMLDWRGLASALQGESSHLYGAPRILSEIHRRFALSFAPFAFVFLGAPVGLFLRRRSRLLAAVVCFGFLCLCYLPLIALAEKIAVRGAFPGGWILWMPNVACVGLGLCLLRRRRLI